MRTITFYSYKGGVGRSLAAINFAAYLARLGKKVVFIDFDLEAPGIDSKFANVNIPENQKGLIDYILEYQDTKNDPGSVEKISLPISIEFSGDNFSILLIPAGNYLSSEYCGKLSKLSWETIFSDDYDGVAFFQNLLARIDNELKPDFLIIDSRTGIGEIAGLCTQQLADEVIIMSSLSGECIKMTKHIKQIISNSEIAKALDKSIDVKVVVSRVPKPKDIASFKNHCCELFDVKEDKLFFIFSSPILEQEEFIAVTKFDRDEELLNNYIDLFRGLNMDLSVDGILKEIKQMVSEVLDISLDI